MSTPSTVTHVPAPCQDARRYGARLILRLPVPAEFNFSVIWRFLAGISFGLISDPWRPIFPFDNRAGPFQISAMVAVNSTMLPLGTAAPNFQLPDTAGRKVSLADFQGRALVVMFICNHCPYVKHIRAGIAQIGRAYQSREVGIVAISSNDAANYPQDGPEKMRVEAREAGYIFPYLYDESQSVAKAYRAACTPDFYVFDKEHRLAYRGQFDDSRPGNGVPVTGKDLRTAMDAVLSGRPAPTDQKPSIGCNIKWKAGNEPDYF